MIWKPTVGFAARTIACRALLLALLIGGLLYGSRADWAEFMGPEPAMGPP